MPRQFRLNERDKNLISDLYKFGVMKMKHIIEIHFPKSPSYAYKRVRELIKRGYIKREGHKYRATDKGVKESNLNLTLATRKTFNTINIQYKLKQCDIYTNLFPYGWEWLNSRTVKAKYNLNRNSRITGQLINKNTKEKYIVYMLNNEPKPYTIGHIKNEIKGILYDIQLNQIIIFHTSMTGYNHFIKDDTSYSAEKFLLLPMGKALNTILPSMAKPNWLETVITNSINGVTNIRRTSELFADRLITTSSGQEYFVTEMITYDIAKRYHLKNYGHDQVKHPVILLTLNSITQNMENFENTFEAYPHIKIQDINDQWIQDLLLSNKPYQLPETQILKRTIQPLERR